MPSERWASRPMAGALVVPFVVDEARQPIDFKALDASHVDQCAERGLCGICGQAIRRGPVAFAGPDDGRTCFADPWMHLECAKLAMQQCPFLAARRGWRDGSSPLTEGYERSMALFIASGWSAHHDGTAWHFEATHGLARADNATVAERTNTEDDDGAQA